ncbi:MAG: iron ABC transporter permease [Bacteroidales bacterium]|nr:iron ABC transporter permease [Bacteroidales bacterium]
MILSLILGVLSLVTLAYGSVRLTLSEVIQGTCGVASDPIVNTIILELRLPRMLLAIGIGAGLGVAGAAYQALFRNPLADPFVVGASSGAAAGATLVIVMGWAGGTAGVGPASVGAFFGAIGSVLLVYAMAAMSRLPAVTLLLAGAVVSTMLGALVWLMLAFADAQVPRIVSWLMGGLAGRSWDTVGTACPLILLAACFLGILGRPLDIIRCGEDTARSLGVPVGLVLVLVLGAASLIVAASVAAGGIIGFVGLAAPHIARPVVGAAHRRLLPASGLIGAILLLGADVVARTIVAPLELPIGVVTALLGGPLFLVVLRKQPYASSGDS